MFHHFHGGCHPPDGQGSLSATEFEQILLDSGISNILPPREWLSRLEGGRLESTDLCLTFDDGLRCQYDVALPVMTKLGLQAFWFVYSAPFEEIYPAMELFRRFRSFHFGSVDEYYREFFERAGSFGSKDSAVDGYREFLREYRRMFPFYSDADIRYRFLRDRVMTPRQYEEIVVAMIRERGLSLADLANDVWLTNDNLRELNKKRHVIGLHSYDHPTRMSALPEREQRKQYKKNFDHLCRVCDEPRAMAHPCNSYSDETIRILKELNVLCGFRSSCRPVVGQVVNPSALELAREDAANVLKRPIPSSN